MILSYGLTLRPCTPKSPGIHTRKRWSSRHKIMTWLRSLFPVSIRGESSTNMVHSSSHHTSRNSSDNARNIFQVLLAHPSGRFSRKGMYSHHHPDGSMGYSYVFFVSCSTFHSLAVSYKPHLICHIRGY